MLSRCVYESDSTQNLAIVYSDSNAYRIHFTFMDLHEATYLLNNSNKKSKKGTLRSLVVKFI